MVAPREYCEFGEMRCEPAPIRVVARDVFLHYVRLAMRCATCEYARGNADFTQALQRGDGDIKFDEYSLLIVMGNKAEFLLPVFGFSDDPICCMKMVGKDESNFMVHNKSHKGYPLEEASVSL